MVNAIQIKHVETTSFPRLSAREVEDLRRINRDVNHAICYLPDQVHYGVPDRAVSFPEPGGSPVYAMSAPRYGDCEDYALTKKDRLVAQGWDPKRLVVALASMPDHRGMVRHAVLAVPDGDEWLVLCNHHDAIDRASSLEQRWGWRFVWPHYGTYRENFAAAEPDDETETL